MNVEWLYTSVRGIGAICVVIAIAECAVEGDDGGKGMRLICGADGGGVTGGMNGGRRQTHPCTDAVCGFGVSSGATRVCREIDKFVPCK